jgi:hypothetical protein
MPSPLGHRDGSAIGQFHNQGIVACADALGQCFPEFSPRFYRSCTGRCKCGDGDCDGQRAAEEIEDVGAMDGTAVQEGVCSETDAGADLAGVGAAVCGDGKSAGICAG